MKIKRITQKELINMSKNVHDNFWMCISVGAYRLIGVYWKTKVRFYKDTINGDIVFEYD